MEIEKYQFKGSTESQRAAWFGSFATRLFSYLWVYFVILLLWSFAWFAIEVPTWLQSSDLIPTIIDLTIWFGVPALVPYLMERGNRKWRRDNGYDIYKNIEEEVKVDEEKRNLKEKMELENEVAKEISNKDDLAYWFDLKEKGAISEEEYEAKKRELL